MAEYLSVKWNNYSLSFLNYISRLQIHEKFCDATIACQGNYFPVHRIVLSACSDYFAEIFDRIQFPHPYIILQEIEPKEMNLLLTYMYKGEVNVERDRIASLIKAAESLKIRGLSIPCEMLDNKRKIQRCNENKRKRKNSDLHEDSEPNSLIESSTSKSINSKPIVLYIKASKRQAQATEVIHIEKLEDKEDNSEFEQVHEDGLNAFPAPLIVIDEHQRDLVQYSCTAETSEIKSNENGNKIISFDDPSLQCTWTNLTEIEEAQELTSEICDHSLMNVESKFYSFEHFESKLKEYEKAVLCNYWIRDSRTLKNHSRRFPESIAAHANNDLKYYYFRMSCIKGGREHVPKNTQRQTLTFKEGCKAGMFVKLSSCGKYLRLLEMNEEHNHVVSESLFQALPNQRMISSGEKKQRLKMRRRREELKKFKITPYHKQDNLITVKTELIERSDSKN